MGSESYPFAEAVRLAYANRVSLSATGYYATPEIVWDRERGRGRPFYYFAYGAACTECRDGPAHGGRTGSCAPTSSTTSAAR